MAPSHMPNPEAHIDMFNGSANPSFYSSEFKAAGRDFFSPTVNVNFTASPPTPPSVLREQAPIALNEGESTRLEGVKRLLGLLTPRLQQSLLSENSTTLASDGARRGTLGGTLSDDETPPLTPDLSSLSSAFSSQEDITVSSAVDFDPSISESHNLTTPQVYVRSMLKSGNGLPCWKPRPRKPSTHQRGTVPGDVGTFSAEGSFKKTFNLWDDEEALRRSASSSNGKSFHLPSRHVTVSPDEIPRGNTIADGASSHTMYSESDPSKITSFEFRCHAPHGAVLAATSSAELEELEDYTQLRECITQHAELIYNHANSLRRIAADEPLYVITGCIKSDSWALAAFRESRPAPHDLMCLQNMARNDDGTSRYAWTKRATSEAHFGSSGEPGLKNQTLFLRGFKLDFSQAFRSRMKRPPHSFEPKPPDCGPSGPSDGPRSSGDDDEAGGSGKGGKGGKGGSNDDRSGSSGRRPNPTSSGSSSNSDSVEGNLDDESPPERSPESLSAGDSSQRCYPGQGVSLRSFPSSSQFPCHPSDAINKYLLEMTGADFALCHDDEWRFELKDSDNMDDFVATYLDELKIDVEHGVASLSRDDVDDGHPAAQPSSEVDVTTSTPLEQCSTIDEALGLATGSLNDDPLLRPSASTPALAAQARTKNSAHSPPTSLDPAQSITTALPSSEPNGMPSAEATLSNSSLISCYDRFGDHEHNGITLGSLEEDPLSGPLGSGPEPTFLNFTNDTPPGQEFMFDLNNFSEPQHLAPDLWGLDAFGGASFDVDQGVASYWHQGNGLSTTPSVLASSSTNRLGRDSLILCLPVSDVDRRLPTKDTQASRQSPYAGGDVRDFCPGHHNPSPMDTFSPVMPMLEDPSPYRAQYAKQELATPTPVVQQLRRPSPPSTLRSSLPLCGSVGSRRMSARTDSRCVPTTSASLSGHGKSTTLGWPTEELQSWSTTPKRCDPSWTAPFKIADFQGVADNRDSIATPSGILGDGRAQPPRSRPHSTLPRTSIADSYSWLSSPLEPLSPSSSYPQPPSTSLHEQHSSGPSSFSACRGHRFMPNSSDATLDAIRGKLQVAAQQLDMKSRSNGSPTRDMSSLPTSPSPSLNTHGPRCTGEDTRYRGSDRLKESRERKPRPPQECDAYFTNLEVGRVPRPGHSSSSDGFRRAGRFKKASNVNYGLQLSLELEKCLAEQESDGKTPLDIAHGVPSDAMPNRHLAGDAGGGSEGRANLGQPRWTAPEVMYTEVTDHQPSDCWDSLGVLGSLLQGFGGAGEGRMKTDGLPQEQLDIPPPIIEPTFDRQTVSPGIIYVSGNPGSDSSWMDGGGRGARRRLKEGASRREVETIDALREPADTLDNVKAEVYRDADGGGSHRTYATASKAHGETRQGSTTHRDHGY
ncbi:hypothetical protein NMY22_g2349 [Coprinellus aureogranulatus]|nr:hypothetical protein NMY22_g2349 [Coprinellus aureogranulatus]